MAKDKFVMVPITFSDGVMLNREGPKTRKEFYSELALKGGKSYITAANFVPKWKAKHFVTTLTVGEDLQFYESVLLGRETVMQSYSESISRFPKDKVQNYRSVLFYDPNATDRRFVAGIELLPAKRCAITETEVDDVMSQGDAIETTEKHLNGDIKRCSLINGEASW